MTYHDPCHVVHGQKIRSEPRALLAQIPGLRVVELTEADWCCGSAGTYNLTQPEMAERLQARKIAHIAGDGRRRGGHRQSRLHHPDRPGAAREGGSPIEVLHIVELLDQAYGGAPSVQRERG